MSILDSFRKSNKDPHYQSESFDDIRKQIQRGYKKDASDEDRGMARAWDGYKSTMWKHDPMNPDRVIEKPTHDPSNSE